MGANQYSLNVTGDFSPPQPPTVDRKRVVALLCNYWSEAEKIANDSHTRADKVVESYNHILPEHVRSNKTVQTKCHLGWVNRAIKAFKARLGPLLMPGPQEFYKLYDLSQTYADSCAVMNALMATLFETGNFPEIFRNVLFTLAVEGAVGGDVVWDSSLEKATGTPSLRFITLNPRDVGVFPVTEPPERCVTAVRTYLTKLELLAQAQADPAGSYDIEAILALTNDKDPYTEIASNPGNVSGRKSLTKKLGREVIDYYCPVLVVDDTVYERVFATVVEGKTLIRFYTVDQNTEPPSPAIFATLDKLYVKDIGPVRVGVGLCHGAYDLEMQAITLNNLNVDNAKDNVKPCRTYDPDDPYFDRDQTDFYPGELIPSRSSNPLHLKPLMDSVRVMPSIQEQINALMYQFESAVGIPNFLSGTADTDDRRVSATAKRLEANGADTRIREYGEMINEQYLRKMVEKVYELIRRRLNAELQQFMNDYQIFAQTGQRPQTDYPLMKLARSVAGPDFESWVRGGQPVPPLAAITLDLSTFETALQKVDETNNAERALGTLGQVAGVAPHLVEEVDTSALIRQYLFSLNLGSALRPASQAKEAREVAEQQQQQMAQMQQQMTQMQVQMELMKAQSELSQTKAEIEKLEAETQYKQLENIQLTQLIQQGPPPLPTKSEQQVRVQ